MLKGLVAGGMAMGIAAVFPEALVYPFFAAVLGFSAGVYPGMAMTLPDGGQPGMEWVVALTVLGLGLLGLWLSPVLLVLAWILHGFWGLLHRITGLGDELPASVAGFSFSFSLVAGSFVAYVAAAG